MKRLIIVLAFIFSGCATSVEYTEYRANLLNLDGKISITHTEYQIPNPVWLDFKHHEIPRGHFGILINRDYQVIEVTPIHDGLCVGAFGC